MQLSSEVKGERGASWGDLGVASSENVRVRMDTIIYIENLASRLLMAPQLGRNLHNLYRSKRLTLSARNVLHSIEQRIPVM
jgi:hypothetical protein